MPIEASNAGLNLGTGGDFTVNSGPFVGARGGSEFWARSVLLDGTNWFERNIATTALDSKTFSLAVAIRSTGLIAHRNIFSFKDSNFYDILQFKINNSDYLEVYAYDPSNIQILRMDTSPTGSNSFLTTAGLWDIILISADLSSTSAWSIYANGNSVGRTLTYDTTASLNFSDISQIGVGNIPQSTDEYRGDLAFCYFTTDYIDFSEETNRNLFVDQLGYPKDLTTAIEAGDIPTPLIYMTFDDPNDLGLNSGTGGDFTVNGTVTQGADVDPNA